MSLVSFEFVDSPFEFLDSLLRVAFLGRLSTPESDDDDQSDSSRDQNDDENKQDHQQIRSERNLQNGVLHSLWYLYDCNKKSPVVQNPI